MRQFKPLLSALHPKQHKLHPWTRLPALLLSAWLATGCAGEINTDPKSGGVLEDTGPIDADGDGFLSQDDCDDSHAQVHPNAQETCDGIDNNCDGIVDERTAADATMWFADADGDGFGNPLISNVACTPPLDHVSDSPDCDDSTASISPGSDELCNSVDDDCDGEVDEDDAVDAPRWFTDADGDGFGDPETTVRSCTQPALLVADDTDCDDTLGTVFPGADEYCNGRDDDCDGTTDEDDAINALTWFADQDADGFGDAHNSAQACSVPIGMLSDATDCDDTNASVHPGAHERCSTRVDDDCDGTINEDDAVDALTWHADSDGDGFGNASVFTISCLQPSGTVADGTDCDDSDASRSPGATELCNGGVDDDCDASTTEVDRVSTQDASGVWRDSSHAFTGTISSPAVASVASSETVSFCPGTYHAVIQLQDNAKLRSSAESAANTIIDGGNAADVVRISGDGVDGILENLTIQSGAGALDTSGNTWGGGIYCGSQGNQTASLVLDGVIVQNSAADFGGGIAAWDCDLTITDSDIVSNVGNYAGGILVLDSDLAASDSEVSDNHAITAGGGLHVENNGLSSGINVVLDHVEVRGNSTDHFGAGLNLIADSGDATVTCIGDSSSAAGFFENVSPPGDAAVRLGETSGDAELVSNICDWGLTGTSEDNEPEDISVVGLSQHRFDNNETFTCDSTGCGGVLQTDTVASMTSSSLYTRSPLFYGNVFQPNTSATLDEFEMYVGPNSSCNIDFYVYSAPSDSGPWTEEWSDSIAASSGTGWLSSGAINLGLASGDFYLLAIDVDPSQCGGRVKRYWKRSASDDPGFGTYEGYWYESYTGTWNNPSHSNGSRGGQYMQRVHSWH